MPFPPEFEAECDVQLNLRIIHKPTGRRVERQNVAADSPEVRQNLIQHLYNELNPPEEPPA